MANEKRLIDVTDALERLRKAASKMHIVDFLGIKAVDIGSVIQFLESRQTVDALIPPVKPWDKVWIIDKTLANGGLKRTVCEGEIFKLSYNGFTTPMEWIDYRWDSPLVGQTTSHDRIDLCLGKTVFLTREEAEAALAMMIGGNK